LQLLCALLFTTGIYWQDISEMTYYVSSGTLNSIHLLYAVMCAGIWQVTCSVLVLIPS